MGIDTRGCAPETAFHHYPGPSSFHCHYQQLQGGVFCCTARKTAGVECESLRVFCLPATNTSGVLTGLWTLGACLVSSSWGDPALLPSADAPSTSGVSLYFACRRGGLALWEHDCCLLGWQLEQLLLVVLGWPDDFGRNANAMRLEPYTRVWCGDVWSSPFGYYFLYTCALCFRAVLSFPAAT